MRLPLFGLLLLPAPAPRPSRLPTVHPPLVRHVGSAPGPVVSARVVDSPTGARAAIDCRAGGPAALELDQRLALYGGKPPGDRAVVSVASKDGLATCTTGEGATATHGALRLRALQIRAVVPSIGKGGAAHVVISIDGQALGPMVASDDGVYLAWSGAIVPLPTDCPEARYTDDKIVVCAPAELVRGRGPARVRVQSAGRLEEAGGAPVDLGAVLGSGAAR